MKGIILAGGSGTRLHPTTLAMSKQLLPVYDKPMIYYPLSTLLLGGIREILIISTPNDLPHFQRLLGDGSDWGISLSYAEQPTPDGVAQAYTIGAEFVGSESSCLILGDNFFYGGQRPAGLFKNAAARSEGATIFAYHVKDPERYGVVKFNSEMKAISLEEKPKTRPGELPDSNWAIPGLYFYDQDVVSIAADLKPSSRGEVEITDINRIYLERGTLEVQVMEQKCDWFDMGTPDSLLDASNFVRSLQKDHDYCKFSCPEIIAFDKGWIDRAQLHKLGRKLGKSDYGRSLEAYALR